jgi:hypothetical protein
MFAFFIGLAITAFCVLLFLNLYFRVKVLKHYKVLIANKVQFNVKDILDLNKIKTVVIPRYPHCQEAILGFVTHIRKSIILAGALLIIITLCWSILNYYR